MGRIYKLIDPRTAEIRYIGQTVKTLKARLREHILERGQQYKVHWIQSVLRDGLEPIIELIVEVPTVQLDEQERYWIKYHREVLCCRLTNLTDGGQDWMGYQATPEVIERRRQGVKKSWQQADNEAKMQRVEAMKAARHTAETNQRVGQQAKERWASDETFRQNMQEMYASEAYQQQQREPFLATVKSEAYRDKQKALWTPERRKLESERQKALKKSPPEQ